MAIITIDEVLEHAERFEQMLADYYSGLAEHTTREGVRLLTDYMSRHRVRLKEALEKLSPEIVERIRKERIRYEPQAADCRCFEGIDLPDDATAAQVLDAAVTLDECLVRLYRQVVRQSTDPDVQDVFESLVRLEERDEIELKKIKAMDYF